jgi:hypothetical protein
MMQFKMLGLLTLVLALASLCGFLAEAAPQGRTMALSEHVLSERGPSAIIYPVQSIPIAFNHKTHLQKPGIACASCHPGGSVSRSSADVLLPKGTACDSCHGTNHTDLLAVQANAGSGKGKLSECASCHEGEIEGNRVARVKIPVPNLSFSHAAHASRNITCAQCHANVAEGAKATREDLPRMQSCLKCHSGGENTGDAKAACETCHVKGGAAEGGRIQTAFASGKLLPPRWMQNAAHDSGFLARHKLVAGNDSQFCANCHKEDFCTECHDGRVRPRSIHPNDYLSMHAIESKQATQKCASCHREQSFCLGCHQRLGVAMSGPQAVRESGRFHPPKEVFSDLPRKPGHHAQEAARNLEACVSCHTERDCVSCHGAAGIGGRFSPHPPDFAAQCGRLFARNPRPCLVCHESESADITRCR